MTKTMELMLDRQASHARSIKRAARDDHGHGDFKRLMLMEPWFTEYPVRQDIADMIRTVLQR